MGNPLEPREEIVGPYRRAWAHSDATITTLALDSVGRVPWWPGDRREVTLHRILVCMIAETHRHAGHADIVRALIDGATGMQEGNDNMAPGDQAWWQDYRCSCRDPKPAASLANSLTRWTRSVEWLHGSIPALAVRSRSPSTRAFTDRCRDGQAPVGRVAQR